MPVIKRMLAAAFELARQAAHKDDQLALKFRIGSTARNVLAVWGAVSLVGLVALLTAIVYSFTVGGKPRDDQATRNDVRYVLNWSGLGEETHQNCRSEP